ncbi:MAG: flagellar basal-body rod protein FlgF [Micavibrio sp.]|nr:flagellar basal-body rod protein FlgF [Micavibrio sp.]
MENISYIGLSQQMALSQQIEVASNNIANMSTPGFKTQGVMFNDYITSPKDGSPIHQSQNFATYRDLSTGNLAQTHNPLDLAIAGEGYFAVSTASGIRYTRDGGFSLNFNRQLVSKTGNIVMSEGGGPLVIPPEAKQITVADDGTVATEIGDVGRVKVVSFDNPQALTKLGNNLYDAGGQAETPLAAETRVEQGVLEGSNVNPVVEMNRMVELMRMFQAAQNMLMTDHDRIRGAIQKLTAVES